MVEYLIQAPRIVKEQAPMNWMFLTCPQDGDVMLVWQPTQMGTSAASDGYVWEYPETAFRSEARGYVSDPGDPSPHLHLLTRGVSASGNVPAPERIPLTS